jgi:hypothetical protein
MPSRQLLCFLLKHPRTSPDTVTKQPLPKAPLQLCPACAWHKWRRSQSPRATGSTADPAARYPNHGQEGVIQLPTPSCGYPSPNATQLPHPDNRTLHLHAHRPCCTALAAQLEPIAEHTAWCSAACSLGFANSDSGPPPRLPAVPAAKGQTAVPLRGRWKEAGDPRRAQGGPAHGSRPTSQHLIQGPHDRVKPAAAAAAA